MVEHYRVKGRVPGVGFRWFVQREAAELGLRGWVRNTDEGDVEVVAAGGEGELAELRAALAVPILFSGHLQAVDCTARADGGV